MYSYERLIEERDLWKNMEVVPADCSWCKKEFEIRYGTLYNAIRRNADGVFCDRKCAGAARAYSTQEKYRVDGGKTCRRCGEFKKLDHFSQIANPPFFRAECKRCHGFKPARKYGYYKDKALSVDSQFELSLDQFLEFWNRPCYYCDNKVSAIRITLKNINNGFVYKNIVSCCKICQDFKSNMEHEDFMDLCEVIVKNGKKKEG